MIKFLGIELASVKIVLDIAAFIGYTQRSNKQTQFVCHLLRKVTAGIRNDAIAVHEDLLN